MMKHRTCIALVTLACLVLGGVATTTEAQTAARDTRNAALSYWQAFALMRDPASDKATLDLIESTATGKGPWDEARLGAILDANEEAIGTMQRATALRACDWGVDWELGPSAPIGHLAKARVLGRLNALAGMRLAARGRLPEAIDAWLAGVKFAQHVAQGGSLISLLTARPVLLSNLAAMTSTIGPHPISDAERQRVTAALTALPESAFDWGAALQREQAALEVAVQQLSHASDLRAAYKTMMGQDAPADFSLPTALQMTAFRALMTRASAALRLPPADASQRLASIETSKGTLHPFLAGSIPSLSRINAERTGLRDQREAALKAVNRR